LLRRSESDVARSIPVGAVLGEYEGRNRPPAHQTRAGASRVEAIHSTGERS